MANLSVLNKMLKIQRLLTTLSAHHSSLSCSTLLVRGHQSLQQHSEQSLIKPTKCAYFSSSPVVPSIDEFRAREEKREKEYAEQQAEAERQEKAKEHDGEEEAKRARLAAVREKILEAALGHVPSLGWSRAAIVRGAEEVGLPSVVHGMFPEGGFALVSYFYGKCNEQLVAKMQEETSQGQQISQDPPQFAMQAVRTRLEMLEPYKAQWPQALALMAAPQNASTALAQVLTLVDDICYYSGDRSVDMSWYTRRIGLATIMKMTEIFMLQDKSPGHTKTWEFLKARVDEATRIESVLAQTEGVTHKFQRSFKSAFDTARNILGVNYQRR